MQIDERALNFIQKAKAAGFSQQEVYDELVAKGYEVGAPREQIQEWKAPEPEKSPYSTMDKVKYTLRAAGEAAPIGMGDLVAGYAATQARNVADFTHGKDWKTRKAGLQRFFDYMNPIGQVQMLKEGTFGKERADFIKEQEKFSKHHGGLNFLGEMVGGALTGGVGAAKNVIGKQGIKALMGAGAREGAKFGSIYGAGSGFTQDADKLSVYDALKGAALGGAGGAVFGAALPPAIAIGGKGLKAGSNLVGKFFGTKKAAEREAQKILEKAGGTSANEVVGADEGVVALKNAIKSDKGLAKEIEQMADEKLINSADTTKKIISDTLGADDIEAAKDLASAQYREVLASDPIYVPDNIYKNKGLKKAVKNAIKNDYNDELEKRSINSLYGVQAVKEELDDMIAKSMVIGKKGIAEPTKATARLQEVKAKFLENVDAVAPQYKQVREDFEKAIAPYNILGGLLKDQGRERANTIKAILTNKNKTAISDVFGKEKAEALFDALRKQSRLNENYNSLYNEAHRELTKSTPIGNKAPWRESVESLGSIVGTAADMARFGGAKRLRRNIAEILLSGKNPSGRAITPKSMPEQSGQSIAGYLGGKLKEKGGYIANPLDDTQTGYHGSLNRFKEFSLDHIGSGEGAQAHGYGSYVAKIQDIGEKYRKKLIGERGWIPKTEILYDGKPIKNTPFGEIGNLTLDALFDIEVENGKNIYPFSKKAYLKKIENRKQMLEGTKREYKRVRKKENKELLARRISELEKEIPLLEKLDISKLEKRPAGQVYEVKIPKNDVLLDEHKTFNEQPKKVQDALSKIAKDFDIQVKGKVQAGLNFHDITGKYVYNKLAGVVGGQKQASQTLNKYGIKGIRYVGARDGECFVIFDPKKDIKINKTFYSVLAALASAGLLNNGMKQEAK